ncbi:MAG: DUF3014 domain-containing protein [Betaproteobacteria bacterium]
MTNGSPSDLSYSEPDLRTDPDDRLDPRHERSSSAGKLLLLLGILLLVGGGAWYLWSNFYAARPAPVADATAPAPPPAAAPQEPAVQHPIETSAPAEPLPVLAESDKAIAAALASAIDSDAMARFLVNQDFVRRFVATVDNLPRKTYAQRLSPFKPAPGAFDVSRSGDQLRISPQNTERYALAVRMLEAVNTQKLVATYVRYYPLFQEAYREQGYPKAYFNDRLVEALDVMIATRESPGQLALAQPKVLYEYADPALESLPAGQKIMLRLGPENAARAKVKLREIRALVAKEGGAAKAATRAP